MAGYGALAERLLKLTDPQSVQHSAYKRASQYLKRVRMMIVVMTKCILCNRTYNCATKRVALM